MHLQPVSLRGRRFAIQFHEIIGEFGSVIPWLDGLYRLGYATNSEYFRDEFLRSTRQEDGTITPFQFIETGRAGEFLGGVLHFGRSPEGFLDRRNCATQERLAACGVSYISCLQVRGDRRGVGVGREMFPRALYAILRKKGAIWGVVSNPRLLPWYKSLGAQCLSPLENLDNLWIVQWNSTTDAHPAR